jgi:colanic acid biosynthesis glycosyl transferase WcaI
MRILIVTQIYLPEMGALANRLYPIARQLREAGHQVFVATGMPNYPQGVVFPGYRRRFFMREEIDGVTVLRTVSFTAPRNRSKWSQLLNYLCFIPAAFHSGLRAGRFDVVLVSSPPLFATIPAILLAKLRNAKLLLDIRDLWPDELIGYGGIREDSAIVRILSLIERWAYHSADCILGTTQAILDTVSTRGAALEKQLYLPNGADLELFRPLQSVNAFTSEYSFGNRFVVMYSGLFGIKHGLDLVLETAALLKHDPQIVFLLLGDGPRRDELINLAAKMELNNVIFAGQKAVSDLPWLLARADVCLTVVQPGRCSEKVNSVKTFEYMACEKPVVLASNEAGSQVLIESKAGVLVPPRDASAMAKAIQALRDDPARRLKMGRLGRRYVQANYSRSTWAGRLEEKMRTLRLRDQKDRNTFAGTQKVRYEAGAQESP